MPLSLLKQIHKHKKKQEYIESINTVRVSNRPSISLFKVNNCIDGDGDDNDGDDEKHDNDDDDDDEYPNADFYLDNLNTNVYADKLTINKKTYDIGTYDVKAMIIYPLEKNPFYFGVNNEDFDLDKINNTNYIDNDIVFMLDSDAFKHLLIHITNNISNAEIDKSYNEHINYFNEINTSVTLTIPRFYTFYIANELFDSPKGELLFNNEDIVVNNLTTNINTSYENKVTIVANNWSIKYNKNLQDKNDLFLFPYILNNENEINDNPSKKIFDYNLLLRPEIFNDINRFRVCNSNTYHIPFLSGDSITFKITIYPDENQSSIINNTKTIKPLIYLTTIKFI